MKPITVSMIFHFCICIFSQQISIDLNNPLFLLARSLSISTITTDYNSNYIVAFSDGTGKIFNQKFINMQNISFNAKIEHISCNSAFNPAMKLTNGTILPMNSFEYIEAISMNQNFLIFDWVNFNLKGQIQIGQTILALNTWFYQMASLDISIIFLILPSSIKIFRNYEEIAMFSFNFANNNVTATAAVQFGMSIQYQANNTIQISTNFYVALNNSTMMYYTISSIQKFNFTSSDFDHISSNYIQTFIYSFSQNMVQIKEFVPNIYMLQGQSQSIYIFDVSTKDMSTIDSQITCDKLVDVQIIFSLYYIACLTKLIEISYFKSNNTLIELATIPLPTAFHYIMTDFNSLYFMYNTDYPELYKIYPINCSGAEIYDYNDQTCISYNWTINN